MSNASNLPVELTPEELNQVAGGLALGKNGFRTETALETMIALNDPNRDFMIIVDGVIMNKDELGMI